MGRDWITDPTKTLRLIPTSRRKISKTHTDARAHTFPLMREFHIYIFLTFPRVQFPPPLLSSQALHVTGETSLLSCLERTIFLITQGPLPPRRFCRR